jgi:hypothetical protein
MDWNDINKDVRLVMYKECERGCNYYICEKDITCSAVNLHVYYLRTTAKTLEDDPLKQGGCNVKILGEKLNTSSCPWKQVHGPGVQLDGRE